MSLIIVSFTLGVVPMVYSNQPLKFAFIEFPPATFTNESGKPDGFITDIAVKVSSKAGYDLHIESYPTKRMVSMLVKGDIHFWIGLTTLPRLQGTTLVGNSIVTTIDLCAYTIGKRSPVLSENDLIGKSVIILRGYSYGGWINFIKNAVNNVDYHETNEHRSALIMLKLNRADYLLDYKNPSEKVLEKYKISNLNFNIISSLECRFVVSKKAPNPDKLLQQLENAYKLLLKEGGL